MSLYPPETLARVGANTQQEVPVGAANARTQGEDGSVSDRNVARYLPSKEILVSDVEISCRKCYLEIILADVQLQKALYHKSLRVIEDNILKFSVNVGNYRSYFKLNMEPSSFLTHLTFQDKGNGIYIII